MSLASTDERNTLDFLMIEKAVDEEAPSVAIAYVLAIFLGLVAAHRFYLGRPGSAVLQILSWLLLIAPIWWIVDLIRIPKMVREKRQQIRDRKMLDLLQRRAFEPAKAEPLAAPAPAPVLEEATDRAE